MLPETPMMQQYKDVKNKYPDTIIFFRLGDFYEMFGEDALWASRILNIALTMRDKKNKIPMCGVPYHAAENYIIRLTQAGKKVAICEQTSDPALPGLVKREVVRIITPGTTFDERILDKKSGNYLIAIAVKKNRFALAVCDITTGYFRVTSITEVASLRNELIKIKPKECVIYPDKKNSATIKNLLISIGGIFISEHKNIISPREILLKHFKLNNLSSFGIEDRDELISAAGILIDYLKATQFNDLLNIKKINYYRIGENMILDEASLKNLDIFYNSQEHGKEGTLLSVIDKTETAMGGRMLKNLLLNPLLNREKIEERLSSVEFLINNSVFSSKIKNCLENINDFERILSRICCLGGNARDLLSIAQSLKEIPKLKEILATVPPLSLLGNINNNLLILDKITTLIFTAIKENAPLSIKDGGIIKDGYDKELDEQRKIAFETKDIIGKMQTEEIKKTKINSLKIRYNKIFGYYIEITKTNLDAVPQNYIRKQTLVNAERFITPELKEFEEKIFGAEEKIINLEYKIFLEIRTKVLEKIDLIQKNSFQIAYLDALLSLATVAKQNNYCKPELNDEGILYIKDGRHPVLEVLMEENGFIPNDLALSSNGIFIDLITGPNMAGKSTYLRQNALIVLMAHIGSFVPASLAKINLVDRIFTRIGASDNLIRGKSTFMIEMEETSNILNNATEKSLIILDEVGRGTSTYDGLSIAWSILEFLHDKIKAKTLFATHYHELIKVAETLNCCKNLSVAVREKEDGIIFLYKIIEGGINRSYGIEVAKIAGLPTKIVRRSQEILKNLEKELMKNYYRERIRGNYKTVSSDQLSLFIKK